MSKKIENFQISKLKKLIYRVNLEVYKYTSNFPSSEVIGIGSQLRSLSSDLIKMHSSTNEDLSKLKMLCEMAYDLDLITKIQHTILKQKLEVLEYKFEKYLSFTKAKSDKYKNYMYV